MSNNFIGIAHESKTVLAMWVIYDHPSDYPDCWIARQWLTGVGCPGLPTDAILTAVKLDNLRALMVGMGLTCLAPSSDDDPKIVEVWL